MTSVRVPDRLGKSHYLTELARTYAVAPSAVLIRTAEAELLAARDLKAPVLDLACGDGYFAWLVQPDGMEAGCDISIPALKRAAQRRQYRVLACAHAMRGIPFPSGSFQTVVSNSSLEHMADIDSALREIARVLRPGGKLYFTLLSNYAYEWWPLNEEAKHVYMRLQPVYNYYSLDEWRERLGNAGLTVTGHQYYLGKAATKLALWLDYHFFHLTRDRSPIGLRIFIRALQSKYMPVWMPSTLWRWLLSPVRIAPDGPGGGLLIEAELRWKD